MKLSYDRSSIGPSLLHFCLAYWHFNFIIVTLFQRMNVWDRLLGSSIVGTGILSNNMMSPSPECYTAFWMITTHSDTLNWSSITPILTLLLILTLLPNLTFYLIARGFHRTFATNEACQRGRVLLRTPGPVLHWDLQMFLYWEQCLLNLSCFRIFEFRTSLGASVFVPYSKK